MPKKISELDWINALERRKGWAAPYLVSAYLRRLAKRPLIGTVKDYKISGTMPNQVCAWLRAVADAIERGK